MLEEGQARGIVGSGVGDQFRASDEQATLAASFVLSVWHYVDFYVEAYTAGDRCLYSEALESRIGSIVHSLVFQ